MNYYEHLKNNVGKRTIIKSLLTDHTLSNKLVFEASYQISLFIAKSRKNHTIGEKLIKPLTSVFRKTVHEEGDKVTASRRIDETREEVEKNLFKNKKFLITKPSETMRMN